MARLARVVAPGIPHHVTQRGNARQLVFQCDADRLVYLQLLGQHARLHRLALLGYCLMSNHVHLIAVPAAPESLALTLRHTHGRYAGYFNARYDSSGHLWQGRYYSCPLDPPHLWAALRYTELNPVRAGLAATPEAYPWSSASAHCASGPPDALLDVAPWAAVWTPVAWRRHLAGPEAAEEAGTIRRATHTGRPLGAPEFVAALEKTLRRRLAPEKGGRPRKRHIGQGQEAFAFNRQED